MAEHHTSGNTPRQTDTERVLLVKILNSILAGGGGGVTSAEIIAALGYEPMDSRAGNYGGGQPNFTPTSSVGLGFDTSNGTQWNYFAGSWH